MSNLKLVFYVKKGKPYVYLTQEAFKERPMLPRSVIDRKGEIGDDYINGKIIIECDFDVEEIKPHYWESCINYWFEEELLKKSCLDMWQMRNYLKRKNGYAIHIRNLHIFDKPKKTSEYNTYNRNGKVHIANIPIYTAPQNMMYAFDYYGNPFVLISISSQEAHNILNGKQDVLIRRNVLKEMTL